MQERFNKESLITLIEPAATSGGVLDSHLMVDTYYGIHMPTRAAELLKAVLEGKGWKNVKVVNPNYNEPAGIFTEEDWKTIYASQAIGTSFITRTEPEAQAVAEEYLKVRPDGIVIAGGQHATFAIPEILKWAHYVARGEGEEILPELLEAIEENGNGKGVLGVSRKEGDQIINEHDRVPLTEKQIGELPWPQFDQRFRKMRGVNAVTMIDARGCPYGCPYCSVTKFNGKCQRRISNEVAFPRVRALYLENLSDKIFLASDNFAGKPKFAEELLEWIIDAGLNDPKNPRYMVQLHPTAGLRKRLPNLLRRAGVFLAPTGIESINEESLSKLGKDSLSVGITLEGIRGLRDAKVPVMGMFIDGIDGDTRDKLLYQLEWAKQNVEIAQLFVPTPLVGTQLAQEMEEQGRIMTRDLFLYDGQNVILRSKDIPPYDLSVLVDEMNEEFLHHRLKNGPTQDFGEEINKTIQLYACNLLRNIKTYKKDSQTIAWKQSLRDQNWRY